MSVIREANETDFEKWAQMRNKLWPTSNPKEHLTELQEYFDQAEFRGWVAVEDEKYIGFAEASVRAFANGCESRPVVFLEGVWVNEAYRHTGVGRGFLSAVENWAKSKNIFEIGSDAELTNVLSQKCHMGWGFEETERVVYFRKKLI